MELSYSSIAKGFARAAVGAVMVASSIAPAFAGSPDRLRQLQQEDRILRGQIRDLNKQAATMDEQTACGKELLTMANADSALKKQLHEMKLNGALNINTMCSTLQKIREHAALKTPTQG